MLSETHVKRSDTVLRRMASAASSTSNVPATAGSAQHPLSRHPSARRSIHGQNSSALVQSNGSGYYGPGEGSNSRKLSTDRSTSSSSAGYAEPLMPGGFPEAQHAPIRRPDDSADGDDDETDSRVDETNSPVIINTPYFSAYATQAPQTAIQSVDYAISESSQPQLQHQEREQQIPSVVISPRSISPVSLVSPQPVQQSKPGNHAQPRASMRIPTRTSRGNGQLDDNSAFFTPVPVNGNPTEVLSQRFSVWRKVLKELIAYFEVAAASQETRSKECARLGGIVAVPFRDTGDMFLRQGGIQDTAIMLRDYHKQATLHAADAARQISEIAPRLKELRRDLALKIKEIKALSGDFKNSVAKEQELTKKQVSVLTEALSAMALNPHLVSGKYDPYIVKLAVEKQLRKQIEEENYLHQAYLNIETSGKALEEIVVKEIQQAFDIYCGLLNREGQDTLDFAHNLTINLVGLPPSKEWDEFVRRDPNFVDPTIPVRKLENISYPGRDSTATNPIRAGPLERRTKYLKSYTSAWYVLTPTYLHEFKTSDRKNDLTPVMSLLLQDCHVSDHSDSSSHSFKFLMKGKQTGQFHRGHSWMFRAESYEQMMVWYNDIKRLTEIALDELEDKNGRSTSSLRTATPSARPSSEYYNRDLRNLVAKKAASVDDGSRLSYDSSGSGVETNY
ncbi:hypothetical protein V1525DRAFT_372497 [Lipomyces kononenkoae]|uniref:Uncharacterized protein n=1 Tax=Lipomyces kononenkoae TaxID=34357 RepID=A0ACC3T6T7_LIPKO